MRARGRQLTLDQARKATGRGGWRPGAGRPRGRTRVAHARREWLSGKQPLHVTSRTVEGVAMRREAIVEIVRDVIEVCGRGEDLAAVGRRVRR